MPRSKIPLDGFVHGARISDDLPSGRVSQLCLKSNVGVSYLMKWFDRIPTVVDAVPGRKCCLSLRFDDGRSGEVDISAMIPFDGVFEPLNDPAYFARVRVDSETGTIVWPNGADLDPLVLYAAATGESID